MDDPLPHYTENERVEDWREQVLLKAGYPSDDALTLARDETVDLHLACALLRNGCSVEVACQILR